MPVVVTGADEPLARAVVEQLCVDGQFELRATVDDRDAVAGLVRRGVKTAVSDLGDAEGFAAVLEGAHTLMHLRGWPGGRRLDDIGQVLAAATDTGLSRIVTVVTSYDEGAAGVAALRQSGYDVVLLVAAASTPVAYIAAAAVAADRPVATPGMHVVPVSSAGRAGAGQVDR